MVTGSAAVGDQDVTRRPFVHGCALDQVTDFFPARQPRLGGVAATLTGHEVRGGQREPSSEELDGDIAQRSDPPTRSEP